jgi:uncharacterized membrane protein YbhN (UPF0104 family)
MKLESSKGANKNTNRGARKGVLKALRVAAEAEEQAAAFCRARPDIVLAALGVSLGAWVLIVVEYVVLLRLLGLTLSLPQALAALTAARIAFLMPAPGGLGTLEASQALAMQALGIDPAYGIAAGLVIRGRDVLFAGTGLLLGGRFTSKIDHPDTTDTTKEASI